MRVPERAAAEGREPAEEARRIGPQPGGCREGGAEVEVAQLRVKAMLTPQLSEAAADGAQTLALGL